MNWKITKWTNQTRLILSGYLQRHMVAVQVYSLFNIRMNRNIYNEPFRKTNADRLTSAWQNI